jgi:hypothetical protein
MLEAAKDAAQMADVQPGETVQDFFACRARYPHPRRKEVHDRFA